MQLLYCDNFSVLDADRGSRMRGAALKLACGILTFSVCLEANTKLPDENYESLAGVKEVHTVIEAAVLPRTAAVDESLMLQYFEMGIMREGLKITKPGDTLLICQVSLLNAQVAEVWYYTTTIKVFDTNFEGRLFTLLYEHRAMASTPNTAPWKDIGQSCSDQFTYPWLRANTESKD